MCLLSGQNKTPPERRQGCKNPDPKMIRYPTDNIRKEIGAAAVAVALLVYLFLALFQPFGTYNYAHPNKYLLLAPYAIIAFVTFFTGDHLASKYYPGWNWANEIVKNCVLLLFCSLLNYGYSIYFINDAGFDLRALCYMILFTYALGIPVCSIAILGKYAFLKNNTTRAASITAPDLVMSAGTVNSMIIVPDVGTKVDIIKEAFLYARSEGNYSNIFYLHNDQVKKLLLRITLKNLEAQICGDAIIRCHRSYILNKENATGKQGNAQGFKISLKYASEKVPVSRKYIGTIAGI